MQLEINSYEDIESLLTDKVSEGLTLDYKRELPDFTDDNKKLSFLKDICSFSNTHGGQIIYGIEEERGHGWPSAIPGIDTVTPDHERLRILSIIKSGLEPRATGIKVDFITHGVTTNKSFVIIKVPPSWNAPHWIAFNDHHKFYGRASCNNYELSITEIRDKINMMHTIKDKILKFRQERVEAIINNQTPIELQSGVKIIIHFIPIASFSTSDEIDMKVIADLAAVSASSFPWFAPFGTTNGYDKEITLEGLLTYPNARQTSHRTYSHFYRDGIIESVATICDEDLSDPVTPKSTYEKYLLSQKYLDILNKLNFTPPVYAFASLINAQGHELKLFPRSGQDTHIMISPKKFASNKILLREIVIDSFDTPHDISFKPLFDRICNACGLVRCFHYDEDGSYQHN